LARFTSFSARRRRIFDTPNDEAGKRVVIFDPQRCCGLTDSLRARQLIIYYLFRPKKGGSTILIPSKGAGSSILIIWIEIATAFGLAMTGGQGGGQTTRGANRW